MKVEELGDVLQSSCLAPLFADLDKPETSTDDGKTIVRLKAKVPDSTKKLATVVVISAANMVVIRMRPVAQTKSSLLIARVGHVNHMTTIPKVCWDPSDGEVSVGWTLLSADGDIPPVVFEKVLAHVMNVYHGERLYFREAEMKELVERGVLEEDAAESMLKAIQDKYEADYLPLIERVLKG